MAKKGGIQQLQTEVNTDDDLEKFLEREGILVLDVFSEWAGNCVGMVGYLKKAKLEIGGDNLNLAICKSDTIEKLERFRNRSEPTWLFCSNKKIVNMLLGCNVPKLMAIIIQELKNEELYKAGEYERTFYEFDQLLPDEEEREVIIKQQEEETERIELEQSIEQRKDLIRNLTDEIMKHIIDLGVTLFFPHVMKEAYRKTADIADKMELSCKDRKIVRIKPEMLEILFFEIDNPLPDDVIEYIFTKEILIFLWKLGETDTRAPEEVLRIFHKAIADGNIVYDDSGEKIIHSSPAILESIEFVPGYEPPPAVEQKPNMNRRISGAHKQPPPQHIVQKILIPLDENGEPMKTIKMPATWTPMNKRSNAAFIYIFFRSYVEHFVPPGVTNDHLLPDMIPQHLLFTFEAYKRQNIFETCKPNREDVLAFGYFSSGDIETCTLLAKTTEKYDLLKPTVNDKLMMKVAKKRSDIVKRLMKMGPSYFSKNTIFGKTDCEKLFPEEYNVPDEEECSGKGENESKKKRKKRRKKRDKIEGDGDQSTTADQLSQQDSEDTIDELSNDDDDFDDTTEKASSGQAPPPPSPSNNVTT